MLRGIRAEYGRTSHSNFPLTLSQGFVVLNGGEDIAFQ